MFLYLLKSSACLAVFMLFYKLFLERESFHKFKRFYLLVAIAGSFCIPFITFTTVIEQTLVQPILNEIATPAVLLEAPIETSINWWPIMALSIYALGVLFFGVKFILNLYRLLQKINLNDKVQSQKSIIVLLKEHVIPHTFLKYMFFEKEAYNTNRIPKEILLHEEVHVAQKHSLDIIFIELLQVVFWFHPLIYFIKKDIKLNHEFLADQAVIKQGFNAKTYQNLLLEYASQPTNSLISSINYASIKKRLTIMKTHTSKTAFWLRSLILLPLVAVLVYGFSERKEVVKDNSVTQEPGTQSIKEGYLELEVNKNSKLYYDSKEINVEDIANFIKLEDGLQIKLIYKVEASSDEQMALKNKIMSFINSQGVSSFSVCSSFTDSEKTEQFQKQDNITISENIVISVTKGQSLYVNDTPTTLKALSNTLNKYNSHLSREDRKKLTSAEIVLAENENIGLVSDIKDILRNYGYYELKITRLYEKIKKGETVIQEGISKEELAEYNSLAKNINSIIEKQGVVKLKDAVRVKELHSLMSEKQRKNAEALPDFSKLPPPPPPAPAIQESKTALLNGQKVQTTVMSIEEIKNIKLSVEEGQLISFKIKLPGKKTESISGSELNDTFKGYLDTAENGVAILIFDIKSSTKDKYKPIQIVIEEPKTNSKETKLPPPPPPPAPPKPESEIVEPKSKNPWGITTTVTTHNTSDTKNSPKTPPIPSEHMKQLSEKNAVFYYKEKKITSKEAVSLTKENHNLHINVIDADSEQPIVKISDSPYKTMPKPTPENAINHLKVMNRHGAKFYLGSKEITFDEALKVVRKNKNADITSTEEPPIVIISSN